MRALLVILTALAALPARAEPPRVLTDIAPVHSLAALVLGDLGTPELLLPAGADPHDFQMRPSQARALAEADLVIWIGEDLTPWLPRALGNLAGGAPASLELLQLDPLPSRVLGNLILLEDPAPRPQLDADDPGAATTESHDEDAHDHGTADPHAWLDPLNAARFLGAIAGALAAADPDNAAAYRANAEAAARRIERQAADIATQLAPMQGAVLIPYHDAYRYFFVRFGLDIAGGLADAEGVPPSAARIADIRARLARAARGCIFAEPGANPALIETAVPGPHVGTGMLDPLGRHIPPGPDYYETLLTDLARAIATCHPG